MPDAELIEPASSAGKKWYVVHTYSGFEQKAKAALEERVRSLRLSEETRAIGDKFGDVVVPVERVQELGKGVTGFVGHSTSPPEVPAAEVEAIKAQMEEGALRPKPKVLFEVGEAVKVVDGPFQDFNGTVEEVRPEKGKVRVLISIFGRATPVELDFVQVEKS